MTILDENGVPDARRAHAAARAARRAWRPPTTSRARRKASPLFAKYGTRVDSESRARDARRADGEGRRRPQRAGARRPLPRAAARQKPARRRRGRAAAGAGRRLPESRQGKRCRSRSCAASSACCGRSCDRGRGTGPAGPSPHRARGAARASIRALRRHASCARTRREWEARPLVPRRRLRPHGRARAASGLKYPEALRRAGRRPPARRGAASRSSRAAARAAWRPASARTSASRRRRSSSSAPRTRSERYLAPAIRGEKIAALGITEPDAGSDVAGDPHPRERVDGGWVVNGSKMFITNGVRAALRRHRGQDDRARAATTGSRFLIVETAARA